MCSILCVSRCNLLFCLKEKCNLAFEMWALFLSNLSLWIRSSGNSLCNGTWEGSSAGSLHCISGGGRASALQCRQHLSGLTPCRGILVAARGRLPVLACGPSVGSWVTCLIDLQSNNHKHYFRQIAPLCLKNKCNDGKERLIMGCEGSNFETAQSLIFCALWLRMNSYSNLINGTFKSDGVKREH